MTFRNVTEKDYLDWWRIYMADSVNPFLYFDPMDEKQFKSVFDDLCKKGKVFVYEKDQQIVGICELILLPNPHQDTLIVGSVAIDPHHQRKGYGVSLFEEMFKWIKENHPEIVRIELYAETDNPKARKLYEKLGFKTEVILTDWFKRHGGTHQHKWYMSEHIMTLMLKNIKTHPVHLASDAQTTSSTLSKNSQFRLATSADESAVQNLKKKEADYLSLNFQAHLRRGNAYVLEQNQKIMAYGFVKPGSGRLSHNGFIEMCIFDSHCSDEMKEYFLFQLIHSQEQQPNRKRLEIKLLADASYRNNILNVGFESKGKLHARFKHPITNEYIDEEVLEYSLFNLDDALACIEASEQKTAETQKLMTYVNEMKSKKLDPESQQLIYRSVREILKD